MGNVRKELVDIFENFEEIQLTRDGFSIKFEKGTDVANVFSRFANLLERELKEEKTNEM